VRVACCNMLKAIRFASLFFIKPPYQRGREGQGALLSN
jgi:hypothetical protein